jgi:hypothetical protein
MLLMLSDCINQRVTIVIKAWLPWQKKMTTGAHDY